jgi:hypothetical protein
MTPEEHLERHLALCKQIYLRLKAEGKWPWPDSQFLEDLIESEDTNSDL